jgi:polygalacturonase
MASLLRYLAAVAALSAAMPAAATVVECRNQTDCTDELQAALLDATAAEVVIGFAEGRQWITRPLVLNRSNVAVVVEAGVVLHARRGFFHGLHDTLLTIEGAENVSLTGAGGRFRMWREDYANLTLYSKAEWRAGINLLDCTNVSVKHLTIENTGGDGLYLTGVTDSRVHNVTTDGAYRNGLSIISAENLLVDNCSFLNTGHFPWDNATGGTAPRAGVDLEPNMPSERLVNVTLRDCLAAGNVDDSYTISANYLTTPLSVAFERCVASATCYFTPPPNTPTFSESAACHSHPAPYDRPIARLACGQCGRR